jgi:hypothetical protein
VRGWGWLGVPGGRNGDDSVASEGDSMIRKPATARRVDDGDVGDRKVLGVE